jgi:starch phosphorylase
MSEIATDTQADVRRNAPVNIRRGLGADAIVEALIDNLHCLQGKLPQHATRNDWYMALAYTIRDRMMDRYIATVTSLAETNTAAKAVAYLSAEFLTGPHLGNGLINLGIWQNVEDALNRVGQDLSLLLEQEEEPGLGNGGLGRLAACYMDSLATLNVPAIGYGIRYEFGIFDQVIRDGWQVEMTDKWLRFGNPWEILRSEVTFDVKLGGHTEHYHDREGRYRVRWLPEKIVKGVAYDTPVPGYRVPTTNLLRLWKAEATESFDLGAFNVGDYYGAVHEKVVSETISKVLYPNDEPEAGKQLRLAQQYFFVSCSLQDMIRLLQMRGKALDEFHLYWAAQLNDTHPPLPSPNSCGFLWTSTQWNGIKPGPSRRRPAATLIILFLPRHWSDGRYRCSPNCCRVISKSSTRSIAVSLMISDCAIRVMINCSEDFR